MSDRTRVLIADGQGLYREGLRKIMSHWPEFCVVGEVSDGGDAVAYCDEDCPDMVLLDALLPTMNGVEAARLIRQRSQRVLIVMLTGTIDDNSLFGSLYAGVNGYILKDASSRELRAKLREVVNGEMPISGLAARKVVAKLCSSPPTILGGKAPQEAAATLSEREVMLLRLVAQGLSNDEIATRLYLSVGTVKKQLSSLMQRLSLENRVQMAVWAIREGVVN